MFIRKQRPFTDGSLVTHFEVTTCANTPHPRATDGPHRGCGASHFSSLRHKNLAADKSREGSVSVSRTADWAVLLQAGVRFDLRRCGFHYAVSDRAAVPRPV